MIQNSCLNSHTLTVRLIPHSNACSIIIELENSLISRDGFPIVWIILGIYHMAILVK